MTTEKIPLIEKDISIMKEQLDTLTIDFKEHSKKMDMYFERLEGKFAGKWTEKVLIFIWTWIWIAIIGALMTLILKQ